MKVAISNIAWDRAADSAIADLLPKHGIFAIDVAPGKYFSNPAEATDAEIRAVRAWWADRGISITGMQALLFGTSGLNVFGTDESRDAMLAHLDAVCRIGAGLGGSRLVFGSPKNRDRTGLSEAAAHGLAVAFFERLGRRAATHGVVVCLEPNPPLYGSNFMMDTAGTAKVVEAVGDPAIRMQFDTGAVAINEETPGDIVARFGHLIGHIHASEPNLVPLGDGGANHAACAKAVRESLPSYVVTIEMVETKSEPPLRAIERAIGVAMRSYGDSPESTPS